MGRSEVLIPFLLPIPAMLVIAGVFLARADNSSWVQTGRIWLWLGSSELGLIAIGALVPGALNDDGFYYSVVISLGFWMCALAMVVGGAPIIRRKLFMYPSDPTASEATRVSPTTYAIYTAAVWGAPGLFGSAMIVQVATTPQGAADSPASVRLLALSAVVLWTASCAWSLRDLYRGAGLPREQRRRWTVLLPWFWIVSIPMYWHQCVRPRLELE